MDYSFKLYNINLTFALNHPVSFAFDAAYFYMQAACVMVIGAVSTPRRHYYLSNMSDNGEGNGRKRRRTVTEDEGMDTDEGNSSAILINLMLTDFNLINWITPNHKFNYFRLQKPQTTHTHTPSHSHHRLISEAVLLGEEGDEEEVKGTWDEIEEVAELVVKEEKGDCTKSAKAAIRCTTRLANINIITWRVGAVISIDARITDSAVNGFYLAANHFMNFTNTKPYLPNTDNISLNTGKGLKVGKEIEKVRKEGEVTKGEGAKGEGTKGEGKGKRRKISYKRSNEAVKRRLESSKAKLKAKRLARNDGNPMPSPMPEARKDGNPMPSPMPVEKRGGKILPPKQKQNAGKGKVKASKP